MNTKKIVSIVIIVLMLGASIFLIYKNFLSAPKIPTSVLAGASDATGGAADAAASKAASLQVLPYGQTLDFSLLHQYNSDGRIFNYQQVDSSQVGVGLSDLVQPAPAPPK